MGFSDPIWLWALGGLVVPVFVHLLSRKDKRVIRVGSLRHLDNGPIRQTLFVRLDSLLLLALRCLIITIVALLLSDLFFNRTPKPTQWVLVEPGLAHQKPWAELLDSLTNRNFEIRSLQNGFPLVDKTIKYPETLPDYWSLVSSLEQLQPDRCIVITRSRFPGYAGKRTAINHGYTWLTTEGDSTNTRIATVQTVGDTLTDIVEHSNSVRTSFDFIRYPKMESTNKHAITDLKPIRVTVAGSDAQEENEVILAALRAISKNTLVPLEIATGTVDNLSNADWLIWLSAAAPPVNQIPNVIIKAAPNQTSPLNTRWIIDTPLTEGRAYEQQLTLKLARILLKDVNTQFNKIADLYDRRTMPDAMTFSSAVPVSAKTGASSLRSSASPLLTVVLLMLLVAERFIANRNKL